MGTETTKRVLPTPEQLPRNVHLFMEDPQSAKGLCLCERGKTDRKHPHNFLSSELGNVCICGLPTWAQVHEDKFQGEISAPKKTEMKATI